MIIFDTDILSIFAKINRLELIKKLFRAIHITPMIREELTAPLEYGYDFPKDILNNSSVIIPTLEELGLYNKFKVRLGKGEAEAISIAIRRKLLFATNDRVAQKVAKENGVAIISLQAILKASVKRQLVTLNEFNEIINDIRLRDNLVIPEAEIENIFKENLK
ncbi:MAG: hypothetical protein HS132_19225 [Planctomycetia bacterium]|nr:hypothetical protein [Planctomycetia bacterium]